MTSTEFTAGIADNGRVSSKVLKPPGGGSSDIFGLGNAYSGQGSDKTSANDTTHSRLFGDPSDPLPAVPQKKNTLHQSSIFENQPPPTRGKKAFVRRNPITGEEIVVEAENEEKTEAPPPEEMNSAPSKPIQTSIRVRNPPGGKSSGIF